MRLSGRRLSLLLLGFAFWGSVFLPRVWACYQLAPSIHLRATKIKGTITSNGKPVGGTVLRLHKSVGLYSIEPAHADPHVFGEAVSGEDGAFRFGEVPRGKYVLFVGPPSGMSIDIEVIKPKNSEGDNVVIDNFADGCISATVFSADGQKVPQQPSSIILTK